MKPYDDEAELATYVWNHYLRFLTPVEERARIAVFAEMKAAVGATKFRDALWRSGKLEQDAEVMQELANGVEVFRRRTAHRIVASHPGDVIINRCLACGRIVRTPKARQCLWCGHDWHPRSAAQAAT